MKKCICCNKRSKSIMGPRCGALKCKCKGVYCPHDGTRLKLYKIRFVAGMYYYDSELVKCDNCGCDWTGHPDSSTLQSSFTCEYLFKHAADIVAVG